MAELVYYRLRYVEPPRDDSTICNSRYIYTRGQHILPNVQGKHRSIDTDGSVINNHQVGHGYAHFTTLNSSLASICILCLNISDYLEVHYASSKY